MTHNHDDELKKLLSPLKSVEPGDLEQLRWRKALRSETSARSPLLQRRWLPLVAAVLLGFVLGSVLSGQFFSREASLPYGDLISHSDATFEHVHSNLD